MASESAEDIYTHAQTMLVEGDCYGAIDELTIVLRDHPDDGRLWSLLGVAQWTVGSVSDSIASLETALTLVPVGAEGRLALALGYEVIQRRELAHELFAGLAQEESLPYGVLEPLSRALARAEQPGLALEICQRASEMRPEEAGPLRGMAFYMTQLRREPEQVLPVLFRAFHLEPGDFDTRLLLARRLADCGRGSEGAYLLSAVEIESSRCPSCLNRMREVFVEAGDAENAARCIAALVAIADGDAVHDADYG